MKGNNKLVLFFLFVVIIFVVFLLVIFENKSNGHNDSRRKSLVENIKFKGKVIKSVVIDRYSKKYVVFCIRLEYTNTNEIYIFNDLCALKIRNGTATIPGGLFKPGMIATYVEINMNNSLKNKIYYQNGSVSEYEIGLGSGGLLETDMNLCN